METPTRIYAVFLIFFIGSSLAADSIRLPSTSHPVNYDLRLDVNVEEATFSGSVAIRLNVTSANLTTIALNYNDIAVTNVIIHLSSDNSQSNLLRTTNFFPERQILEITTQEPLTEAVEYTVRANITAAIRNDLKGLYMSSYWINNTKRNIATTFFAPNYARMVFPCYDEPHFKATFDVQITHSNKYHALGNSVVRTAIQQPDGKVITTFQRTLKMSTYLLAFIVSDLTASRDTINSRPEIAVWSQEARTNSHAYALQFAGQVLAKIEDYLGLPYQMSKLYLVAVDDFLMGAMENWGLITFASGRLLGNSSHDGAATEQGILRIVSHEVAHQWFGNLVTCRWWDDIWLNEGFATYLEDLMADKVANQWLLMDQFVTTEKIVAMRKDAERANRKAMSRPVETLQEISAIYDFVAYPKAGSVLRMFHHVVGDQVFQRTLSEYLRAFQYSNAERKDFFAVLDSVAGELNFPNPQGVRLSEAFEHWADNFGFPLVTVTRTGGKLKIDQRRFSHSNFNPHTPYVDFFVPLRFATESSPQLDTSIPLRWLTPSAPSMEMQVPSGDSWYLMNPEAFGYFRVNYDQDNWMRLTKALQATNSITASSRVQLIDDAMTLARFGWVSYRTALDLIRYIRTEVNYTPVAITLEHLEELVRNLRGLPLNIMALCNDILDSLYTAKRETTHVNILLNAKLKEFACRHGYSKCIAEGHELFKAYLVDGQGDPNLRMAMFCGAVQSTQDVPGRFRNVFNLWNQLSRSEYERVMNERQIVDLLQGFACVREENYLQELLTFSLRNDVGTFMTASDRLTIFTSVVSGSIQGTQLGLQTVRNNWNTAEERYGSSARIYAALAPNVVTPNHVAMFNELVFNHMRKEAQKKQTSVHHEAVMASVRQVEENVQFLANHRGQLEEWLKENYPSSARWILSPRLSLLFMVGVCLYLLF